MEIDIRTLILIIGIAHLMQVLVFFHQYRANRNINGPGWWLMWSAAESLAFILILLRSIPSVLPVVIIFQDIIILAGTLFIYIGVMRFFEKKANVKLIIALFVCFSIIHLFFFLVKNDITLRALTLSAFLSFISFLTAISIYKYKTQSISLTANFSASIFIVHGVVFAYRTVMIIVGVHVEVFSTTFFNLLPYFDALIVGLLWTFSFIIMVNERLNSEISEAKSHFQKIFETSPDASVISRLSDGVFIDCNEGYVRISGYSKDEILGKSSLEINIWKNTADRQKVVRMIEEKGFCENVEILFQVKDGSVITGLMSARIIILKGVAHIISVTRDISELKQAEEQLRLNNEQLIKLNTEKDIFFSVIAHDLRGPFGSFLGLTEIMADEQSGLTINEIHSLAWKMKNSSTNIYTLLENLLHWAKIRQEQVPLNMIKIGLLSLINQNKTVFKEQVESKGIDLICDISDNFEVYSDTNILQIVTRNLVSNAIKFTPKGGKITISAKITIDNFVEIAIKDNGIGMDKELVERLFRLDVRTGRIGTEGEPSSGLGLILCRDFIEKLGGKLWVESEVEKGSVFYFTIPILSI